MEQRGQRCLRIARLEESGFWNRCAGRRWLLGILFLCLSLGILAGSFLASYLGLFKGRDFLPLLFSGIPGEGADFVACFSTFLLNLLIFLTFSFLLGVTAFGQVAIPVLVIAKGITVGLGVSYFLWMDGLWGLGRSALLYIPAAAASMLLFLLFSLRALVFSDRLRKLSFSAVEGSLDFLDYWKDYLRFLCLAVVAALVGGALSALGSALSL